MRRTPSGGTPRTEPLGHRALGQRCRPPGRRRIRLDPADVRLGAQDLLGIGVQSYPPTLPGERNPGWLVFDDPDGCPSFMELFTQARRVHGLRTAMAPAPVTSPTASHRIGARTSPRPAPRIPAHYRLASRCRGQRDPLGLRRDLGRVLLGYLGPRPGSARRAGDTPPGVVAHRGVRYSDPPICTSDSDPVSVGPDLGSETDFTRYGRWPRLPGLVVLADHGPGLITGPLNTSCPAYDLDDPPVPTYSHFFDPPQPLAAWNLAGLFNTVGHTLQADLGAWPGWGRTTLTAQLIAPRLAFPTGGAHRSHHHQPVHRRSGSKLCEEGPSAYRMDGGPLTCVTATRPTGSTSTPTPNW